MRTTIDIQDNLLRQAKVLAAANGCKLADVVNEAVQALITNRLAKPKRTAKPKGFKIKPYGGSGVKAGVDLSNNALLLDIMDGLR